MGKVSRNWVLFLVIYSLLAIMLIIALVTFTFVLSNKEDELTPIFLNFAIDENTINNEHFNKIESINSLIIEEPIEIPVVANKCFEGWYLDEEFTSKASFPFNLTKDTTFFAKHLESNLPAKNIAYDENIHEYYITGVLEDQTIEELIIPDAYDNGVNGIRLLTHIRNVNNVTGLLTNNSKIKKLVVGNNISTILDFFAYNSTNLKDITLGKYTTSIAGSAFAECKKIESIGNTGSTSNWWDLSKYDLINITTDWLLAKYIFITFDTTNRLNDESPTYIDSETEALAGVQFARRKIALKDASGNPINQIIINKPTVFPTTVNYRFLGWGLDPDPANIELIDFETHIFRGKNNIILYAKYLEGNVDEFIGYTENYTYSEGTTENVYYIKKSPTANSSTNTNFSSYTTTSVVIPDIYNDDSNGLAKVGYIEDSYSSYYGILFNDKIMTGDLYIGNYIRYIGNFFAGASSVKSINFSDYVIIDTIGDRAFSGCTNVTELSVNAKTIKSMAFYYLTSLETLTLGEDIKSCSEMAFGYLSNATILNFNCREMLGSGFDGYEYYGDQIFYGFGQSVVVNEETDVVLNVGKNVSIIIANLMYSSGYSDHNYTYFEVVNFEEDCVCEEIGSMAFSEMGTLVKINNMPNTLKTIKRAAFSECTKLENIDLPDSLEIIEDYAFMYCQAFTLIDIPDSVTSIGEMSFGYCSAVEEIRIGTDLQKIEDCAFINNFSVQKIYYNAENLTEYAGILVFKEVASLSSNLEVIIGKSVKYLLPRFLPINDTTVSNSDYGPEIRKLTFEEDSQLEIIRERCFEGQSIANNVLLPNSVKEIGDYAFYNCRGITGIELSNSLISIGTSAFESCNNASFTELSIPDSVTTIGDRAFYNCQELQTIKIGKGVKSIGATAFYQTVDLETLYYNAESLDYYAGVTTESSGKKLHVFEKAGIVSKNMKVIIGKDVKKIPNYFIYFDTYSLGYGSNTEYGVEIYSLQFEENNIVEEVGNYAFTGQKNITGSLEIINNIKVVGEKAFAGWNKIQTLTVGPQLEYAGIGAFSSMTKLLNVYWNVSWMKMPTSVSYGSIFGSSGDYKNGAKFHIGANVEYIPENFFGQYVSGLGGSAKFKYLYFTSPSKCVFIGKNAFSNSSFSNIYFNGHTSWWTKTSLDSNVKETISSSYSLSNSSHAAICLIEEYHNRYWVYSTEDEEKIFDLFDKWISR